MVTEYPGPGYAGGCNPYNYRGHGILQNVAFDEPPDQIPMETCPRPLPNSFISTHQNQGHHEYVPVGPFSRPEEDEAEVPGRNNDRFARQETGSILSYGNSSRSSAKEPSASRPPPPRDPFLPYPGESGVVDQENPLTFRAIFLGLLFGSMVNAGKLYSGLKTGLPVGSDFFALLVGFVVIKGLTRLVPRINWLGGPFGPQELAIVGTVANASAGTASIFAGVVPAMFKLDLLGSQDSAFGPLLMLTLVCTFGGLFSAAPMRNFFIIRSAREGNLRFPRSEAMAITIRSLHEAGAGAKKGYQAVRAMGVAFAAAFVQQIAAQYARGIVYDWHIFTWLYSWSNYTNNTLSIENWGWYFTWTPTVWGLGMIVGLNMAGSMFFGSVLAYAIIGPILATTGEAVGQQQPTAAIAGPQWKDYVTFVGVSLPSPTGEMIPSPYLWLLWPGIVMIICSSITELALQLPNMLKGMKAATREMSQGLLQKFHHRKTHYDPYSRDIQDSIKSDLAEHSEKDVSPWIWVMGMVMVVVAACLNAHVQWHLNPGWLVLALLLSAFLGFLNIYGQGTTGMPPPISDIFVLSIFSAIALGISGTPVTKMLLVCIAMITVTGVSEFADALMGDYRIGFLLKLSPTRQFIGQLIGTLASGLTSVSMFKLFANAYPCMLEADATPATCPLPAVLALQAATLLPAMFEGSMTDMITTSSAICCAVLGVISIASSVISHFWLRGERAVYRKWVPNWMAVGIAFVLQNTYTSTALLCGALTAYIWCKNKPANFEKFGIVVAAGMIAGEGIGGLVGAILNIAGVGSERYGIGTGCPANRCA